MENHSLFNPLNLRYNFAISRFLFQNVPYTRQSYIKGEFVSLGAIFARQMEPPAKKYHFNTFPPDRAEVEMYIKEKALEVNLDHFFEHYERHDWCNRKYRKLDGWHFALHHLAKTGTYM